MSEIDDYLKEIARQFATGAATEHSYRLALQQLLSSAIPRATVVNEPSRIECGAPDLLVRENGAARRPIGYVEAKDVGDDDLDGNGVHREQFDRYKADTSTRTASLSRSAALGRSRETASSPPRRVNLSASRGFSATSPKSRLSA